MRKVKIKRRFPSPSALLELMKFKKFIPNARQRRLSKAYTIYDLRKIAKRRTPTAPFDYTDGSADQEISLNRARKAFEDIEFQPNILRDVSDVDLSVEVMGSKSAMPLGIAPTGFTRMMHTEGEHAGVTAAEEFGIPFCLSTLGTRSAEEVASFAPNARKWFQLYMWKDKERSLELIERAKNSGFEVLQLTVDVPVAGDRLRDKYNGMTIPPSLTAKTIIDALPRPEWWINFLTTDPLTFASFDKWDGTVAELLDFMFDPSVDFEDLKWVKEAWGGKVIIKGIQNVDDAKKVADLGADGVLLSNHGGRQLDRAPVPFHLLPEVRKAIGDDVELHMDTGIMHGADVVAALAQGADFTYIGRAYLYGLMAAGREGVDRSLEILRAQMIRTMQLLGVKNVSELNQDHVRLIGELRRG